MSEVFNPLQGPVAISVQIDGPNGPLTCIVAVDTGATRTLLNATFLTQAGYNLVGLPLLHQVVTASGIVSVPEVHLLQIIALGKKRPHFPVMAHNLPAGTNVDGVLGLDFMRGHELRINFRLGLIDLL